jgi:hypothetical protein
MNASLLETQEFIMPLDSSSEEDFPGLPKTESSIRWLLAQNLSEMRGIRRDLREMKEQAAERSRDVESRLRSLEKPNQDIESLKEWKWKMAGLIGLISTAVSALMAALINFFVGHGK